jgi:hypothetical protein
MSNLHFPTFVDPLLQEPFVRDGYVFDNYDGDTVYYHADLGYDVWASFLTGRLLDINSPEIRPLKSREAGTAAKEALMGMIRQFALNRHLPKHPFGHRLRIRSAPANNKHIADHKVYKRGKFGRWLVVLIGADDLGMAININELMLREGFAEPYGD